MRAPVSGRARIAVIPFSRRMLILLFLATTLTFAQSAQGPVTLSYFRLGWSQPDELPTAEPLSQQFIRDTGIHLKNLPVPETSLDQLDLSRKLLESNSGPDVLGVDLIWSGVLATELMDLRPFLQSELPSVEPQLLSGYTVGGKLVAIPYTVQTGMLEYRADLLREYGYNHPPKTWDELELMAERIQVGERAKGRKDFWGYVWQGAAAEALTCNALEWQVSEGGGTIIEEDRTVSVNNRAAIHAWERAARWVGWISPPGVVAYQELDSINVFDSGRAAFNRVWGGMPITHRGQSRQVHWRSSLAEGKTGYTSIPAGPEGSASALGGAGLAVSMRSPHPQEAIRLVQFLIHAQIKSSEEEIAAANQPRIIARPSISGSRSGTTSSDRLTNTVVSRPSTLTGPKYEQLTKAYIEAVHAVLTKQKSATEAATTLEKQLIEITGFRAGPPQKAD